MMDDAVVARIDRPGPPGRALSGVKVAVKDLFAVAGHVTAAGNPWLARQEPAAEDAAVVAALHDAGATLVAKSATDELAMGMFGVNTHYGTPSNPAAPDRVPGGSSSGSASLVCSGEVDLGVGTDTGGSIRVPAAFEGLVGLRPSHGRIDVTGVRPMAPRFDTVGLVARDAETLRRAFTTLVPTSAPRSVRSLVLLTDLLDLATAEVAALTREHASGWAGRLGLHLQEARLGGEGLPLDLREVFWPLMSRDLWRSNGAWFTREQPEVGEGIGARIIAAGEVGDEEVAVAERRRDVLVARLDGLLDDAVAVLPTTIDAAPLRTSTHDELMSYRDRNLALVVPASLVGAPQLTVPIGRVQDPRARTSAPVGASFLGLPGDDELLLTLAQAVVTP